MRSWNDVNYNWLFISVNWRINKIYDVKEFNYIGVGRIFNVPIPLIIMLLVMFLLWVLMAKTKEIHASGSNPDASLLLGVPVVKVQK